MARIESRVNHASPAGGGASLSGAQYAIPYFTALDTPGTDAGFTYNGTTLGVRLAVKGNEAGTAAAQVVYYNEVATGSQVFSGGSGATNGGNLVCYGGSHASKSGWVELYSGSNQIAQYDAAQSLWIIGRTADLGCYFGPKNLIAGSGQGSAFVGELTTGRTDSALSLIGGAGSGNNGGTVTAYGSAHATHPYRVIVTTNGSTRMTFNNAATVTCDVSIIFSDSTSYRVGTDSGAAGVLTNSPVAVHTANVYCGSFLFFGENSSTGSMFFRKISTSSIALRSGSTDYQTWSTTQNNFRLKCHFGASENHIKDFCSGATTTTNATPTNLWTFAAASYSNWGFNIRVSGYARRSDSGTERYYFNYIFHVMNVAGTLTLDKEEVLSDTIIGGGAPALDCTFSGTTIQVQGTGEAAETWKWFWNVDYTMGSA
jgi:hypothetical protein